MSAAILLRGGSTGAPLAASIDISGLYGFSYGYGFVATSEAARVDITGGVPPYTVAWTRVSGHTGTTADYPSNESTTFKAIINNTSVSSVWKAVVTDSASTSVDSNTITVTLESVNFPSGIIIP